MGVVHPADGDGGHRAHVSAKRLRAAIRAGLHEVPVVVRDLPADRYAQVAENQKRHGLTPLELARFIRAQVDAGDSNATIARQLGMNLTAVAHHLSLLDLPPVLDDALKSGRCTSPRTLHELRTLHAGSPGQVHALLASGAEITRTAVSAMRSASHEAAPTVPAASSPDKLIAQANAACDRLERALGRVKSSDAGTTAAPELVALRKAVSGQSRTELRDVIARLMKMLTRRGVLVEDMGQTYLAEPDADGEDARTLRPLQAAAITCRIAFGPRAGQMVLTLQGATPRDAARDRSAAAPVRRYRWFQSARRGAGRSTRPQAAGTALPLHHPAGAF